MCADIGGMKLFRREGSPAPASLQDLGFETSVYMRPSVGKIFLSWVLVFVSVGVLTVSLFPILFAGMSFSTNSVMNTWKSIPVDAPTDLPLSQHSVMLDVNGKPFATFFSENRVPVKSDQIPESVREALIATEDSRFYEHHGVDFRGTVRAFLSTVRGGGQVQGGSGITQQYVKNLLIANATKDEEVQAATAQTVGRKLTEAKSAIELEKRMSKEEILTGYLNTVYFGDGAYGIGAAARHYFNKTPDQLSTVEAATLVGIINSPNAYDPTQHPKAATARRNHVLNRMAKEGYLSAEESSKMRKTKLVLKVTQTANGCSKSKYPFYCAWVRQTLADDPVFGKTAAERQLRLYRGGMTIRTALDPKVQNVADATAREALDPRGGPATAIAVVQPGTGRVAAIATNKGYGTKRGQTEILLPVVPAFQQGSTFKPYTAAAAIEAGYNPKYAFYAEDSFTPEGRNAPKGGFRNSGDGPGGYFDMGGALRHSVNTWFVQMEHKLGVKRVAETAHAMGLTSLPLEGDRAITEKDASLTLGSYEVSVVQVANTYATIAAHGKACRATNIITITDTKGKNVPVPQPDCRQALRPSTADTLAALLGGVIDGKDDGRTGKNASIGRPAGGKTGTTNNAAAVWFAGFTPQWATAVWIGDPRGGFKYPLNEVTVFGEYYSPVFGGGAPAEIWRQTMAAVHRKTPTIPLPKAGGDTSVGVPLVVPDVRGLTPENAATVLAEAGFASRLASEPGPEIPGIPKGNVTQTKSPPGTVVSFTQMPKTIKLYVSP